MFFITPSIEKLGKKIDLSCQSKRYVGIYGVVWKFVGKSKQKMIEKLAWLWLGCEFWTPPLCCQKAVSNCRGASIVLISVNGEWAFMFVK